MEQDPCSGGGEGWQQPQGQGTSHGVLCLSLMLGHKVGQESGWGLASAVLLVVGVRKGTPLASRVAQGVSGPSSSRLLPGTLGNFPGCLCPM